MEQIRPLIIAICVYEGQAVKQMRKQNMLQALQDTLKEKLQAIHTHENSFSTAAAIFVSWYNLFIFGQSL